jgi:hypothetical protein
VTDDQSLIEALRAEAQRVPLTLDAAALHERLARERGPNTLVRFVSVLAAAVGVVAVATVLGRPGQPSVVGPSASPEPSPTTGCALSDVVQHGSWWKEIGGPGAYFNVEPTSLHAGPNPWLIIARFHPEPGTESSVSMWAENLATGTRADGMFNSTMDPTNIYRLSEPAPSLPGGWYLFEQRLPEPGCWRLGGAVDGRTVGSAVIDVSSGARAVPVGTFMTTNAAGDRCFAITLPHSTYDTETAVQGWWWGPGSRGNCELLPTVATVATGTIEPTGDGRYRLTLPVPPDSSNRDPLQLVFYASEGQLAGVLESEGNESVFFGRVGDSQMTFAPSTP